MDKKGAVVGIDVSKSSLDVFSLSKGHHRFTNDRKDFKELLSFYRKPNSFVMEATGCYHHLLAVHLYDLGVFVSVCKPFSN